MFSSPTARPTDSGTRLHAPGDVPEGPATRAPGVLFLGGLALAVVGASAALLAAAVLTLSLKASAIDAANATTVLSITVGVAGLATLVSFPIFGRLSDRTTGRLGRRRPFLILGAVLIAVGSVVLTQAGTTLLLTVGDVVLAVGVSAVIVAATASVAEQFEPSRRGVPSSIIGLGTPVGALLGLLIAQVAAPSLVAMILAPGAFGVIGSIVFAVVIRDRAITAAERPRLSAVELVSTFWVNPVKHPNFAWVWFSRLLIFFGVAAVNAYQAFYLILHLHFAPAQVGGAIFLATLVLVVVSLVFAPITARISDRVGRRKPFVGAAAIIFAIGLVVVATASSFPQFLVAIVIIGLGQGVYFAVDIALATQIVPNPEAAAKDLGILNLASQLPSSIVPAVAPALLALGATATMPQNFSALFLSGAVAAVVGALLILPVRGAR